LVAAKPRAEATCKVHAQGSQYGCKTAFVPNAFNAALVEAGYYTYGPAFNTYAEILDENGQFTYYP
jgi:hypothetical protein